MFLWSPAQVLVPEFSLVQVQVQDLVLVLVFPPLFRNTLSSVNCFWNVCDNDRTWNLHLKLHLVYVLVNSDPGRKVVSRRSWLRLDWSFWDREDKLVALLG